MCCKTCFLVNPTFCVLYIYTKCKKWGWLWRGFLCEKSAKMCCKTCSITCSKTCSKMCSKTCFWWTPLFAFLYIYTNAKSGVGCGGGFLCENGRGLVGVWSGFGRGLVGWRMIYLWNCVIWGYAGGRPRHMFPGIIWHVSAREST